MQRVGLLLLICFAFGFNSPDQDPAECCELHFPDVYWAPCIVLEIKWEETVNRYLQQQSQKDEVEGPTLVNQQHHSDSTRPLDGSHD